VQPNSPNAAKPVAGSSEVMLISIKPDIAHQITKAGLQFMGCYRAANGVCFFLGGKAENKDYGDKEGYRLDAGGNSSPLAALKTLPL
jgi:hypothetical protein